MFLKLLKAILPYKEIGWKEINETFYRFSVLKTPWFRVYLHYLICEAIPDHCHDHPWGFRTFILAGGYWEESNDGQVHWRRPGNTFYRPATYKHKVWTKAAGSWSLMIVGKKTRDWNKHIECRP